MPGQSTTQTHDNNHRRQAGQQIVSEDMRKLGFSVNIGFEEKQVTQRRIQALKKAMEQAELEQVRLVVAQGLNPDAPEVVRLGQLCNKYETQINAAKSLLKQQASVVASDYFADQQAITWGAKNFCNVIADFKTQNFGLEVAIQSIQKSAKDSVANKNKGPTTFYLPFTNNAHYQMHKLVVNAQGDILASRTLNGGVQTDAVSCGLHAAVAAFNDAGVHNPLTEAFTVSQQSGQPLSPMLRDAAQQMLGDEMVLQPAAPQEEVTYVDDPAALQRAIEESKRDAEQQLATEEALIAEAKEESLRAFRQQQTAANQEASDLDTAIAASMKTYAAEQRLAKQESADLQVAIAASLITAKQESLARENDISPKEYNEFLQTDLISGVQDAGEYSIQGEGQAKFSSLLNAFCSFFSTSNSVNRNCAQEQQANDDVTTRPSNNNSIF